MRNPLIPDRESLGRARVLEEGAEKALLQKKQKKEADQGKIVVKRGKDEDNAFDGMAKAAVLRSIFIYLRKKAKVTQKKFSELLGFSSKFSVLNIEALQDRWTYSPHVIYAYARYIGVSSFSLITLSELISGLLHKDVDDISYIEAIDPKELIRLAKTIDDNIQKVWNNRNKQKVDSIIQSCQERKKDALAASF